MGAEPGQFRIAKAIAGGVVGFEASADCTRFAKDILDPKMPSETSLRMQLAGTPQERAMRRRPMAERASRRLRSYPR